MQRWPRRDAFPRTSGRASGRSRSSSSRPPVSDRRGGRLRAAALLLPLLLLPSPAVADEIVLVGGGRIVADLWWKEGDTLFYETGAGTVGLPLDQVVEIREGGGRAPSFRADPDESTAAAPTRQPAPPPPPDPERVGETIERLETALRREGRDDVRRALEARLADHYVLRARGLLRSGRAVEARADYDLALHHRPEHRIALVELGWMELRAGSLPRARALAETGLLAHPGDGWLLELLGETQFRDSRLRDALESFTGAVRARPDDGALRSKLDKVRRDLDAERDYTRELSRHFVLRYDGDRDDALGDLLLEAMEEAYDELTGRLETYPVEPVTVILYTREQFRETTGSGREVAGLFDGKIRLPVGGLTSMTPGVRRVLRHELVHALLHTKSAGTAPRWLHEGLAQLLEPRDPATVRPALAREAAAGGLALDPFSYPKSLSFVAWLEADRGFGRLLWLVELLAERRAEPDALREAFGRDREALEDAWRESLSRGR